MKTTLTLDEDPFVVQAKACGFQEGIDPTKLNQLADAPDEFWEKPEFERRDRPE